MLGEEALTHRSLDFGAALSFAISRTTDAPRSMKACDVGLRGSETTSGLPPAVHKMGS